MKPDQIEKHTTTQSILLHLLPGILFHSFLFAAQHLLTPWMLITRALGLLPLLFGVKKKNIDVGIIVHILCNMMNVVTGVAFIVRMT